MIRLHVSLRGLPFDSERDLEGFFFLEIPILPSKNEIKILSCNETKRNTAYIDDLIIDEKNIKNVAHVSEPRRFY